jgi:hypothetical protein
MTSCLSRLCLRPVHPEATAYVIDPTHSGAVAEAILRLASASMVSMPFHGLLAVAALKPLLEPTQVHGPARGRKGTHLIFSK